MICMDVEGFQAMADTCGRAVWDETEMASRLFLRSQITVVPAEAGMSATGATHTRPGRGATGTVREPQWEHSRGLRGTRTVRGRRRENVGQLPVERHGRNVGKLIASARRCLRLFVDRTPPRPLWLT